MKQKYTLIYVEEYENSFVNELLKCTYVSLVLIRFDNCMNFSIEHMKKTEHIPTFIIDKNKSIELETQRFDNFLCENDIEVDYFFNDSEYNQEYIQEFAKKLELPGALTIKQAQIVRDKVLMKDFVKKIGFDCCDYMPLYTYEDALACAEKWGYPFIIKWKKGCSSIEVFKVNSFVELKALNLNYQSGKYMGERFCEDKIWCIDAIVSDGVVINNFYTWLPYTNLEFAERKKRFIQLACGWIPSYWRFSPKEMTQTIIEKLQLKCGYLHLEVFVSDLGDAKICEFAWRTPGDHMLSNISKLYGLNVFDMLVRCLFKLPVEKVPNIYKCVADVFLPMKSGKIIYITSMESLMKRSNIVDGYIKISSGDVIVSKRQYNDYSGWVQVKGRDIDDIMTQVDNIYNSFEIKTEEIDE